MMANPRVDAYVIITDDCPVTCTLTGDSAIEVRFGDLVGGFELVCERAALLRFIETASRALASPLPDDPMAGTPTPTGAAVS